MNIEMKRKIRAEIWRMARGSGETKKAQICVDKIDADSIIATYRLHPHNPHTP